MLAFFPKQSIILRDSLGLTMKAIKVTKPDLISAMFKVNLNYDADR